MNMTLVYFGADIIDHARTHRYFEPHWKLADSGHRGLLDYLLMLGKTPDASPYVMAYIGCVRSLFFVRPEISRLDKITR